MLAKGVLGSHWLLLLPFSTCLFTTWEAGLGMQLLQWDCTICYFPAKSFLNSFQKYLCCAWYWRSSTFFFTKMVKKTSVLHENIITWKNPFHGMLSCKRNEKKVCLDQSNLEESKINFYRIWIMMAMKWRNQSQSLTIKYCLNYVERNITQMEPCCLL